MVIRDAGGGRHRSAAMASSSSAYRSTGSKSIKTTDTRSTRLVRITQTGLKKTRRSGKSKSEGDQPTKSILVKKKSGGLLRRKGSKTARSVTFKDEVVSEYSDYSTIASERTYSSAESSRSGSTKSLSSRVRSPHRRQPTLDPIEEGETSTQERDPPEPEQSSGSDDAFFHLGALPAIKGWSPQEFSMPTFHDATRNMNSWLNAHTSSNRAVNEAVPLIAPCSAAAAAASIAPSASPTNANDRTKDLMSTPSSTSSVGLDIENEVVAALAPTASSTTHEETKANMLPNAVPPGKPPLHPTPAPRCPPSPTRSIVTPAEPKYGNFQPDEASLQESIEVSEATPKAGNAVIYHSSTGISLSSGSGASDATPTIGHTPLVIEVPSIIISSESNGEGGYLDTVEVASIPSLGSSNDAMSNASNQNSQNSPPSLEEKASVHSDQGSDASKPPLDNAPSIDQSSQTSASGDGGDSLASSSMSSEGEIPPSTHSTVSHLAESANKVEEKGGTRAPSKTKFGNNCPRANGNEETKSTGPKYTTDIIEQMDKPSRPNQHKRSISLPKYFDSFKQYGSTGAAGENKVHNEPSTSGPTTSNTIVQIGGRDTSDTVAQVIKEAKETAAESVINIHVHLNSNEVRTVADGTSSNALAVAKDPVSSKTDATEATEKRYDEEKGFTLPAGDDTSSEEHVEEHSAQTSAQNAKDPEVAQVEIVESVEMDMDELALLSTRQCIMECKDPLSSQNPDPVIKKPRRQPRKSAGCATILSNGAGKCIRHCAEGVGEAHGCQLFSNIFSCANEADALGDIDWDSDDSDDTSVQHRERRAQRSKDKKKKKHRSTRQKRELREKEEDPSVAFDSGGLSFRLAVDLPGSDDGFSQVVDESRHREEHGSRDDDWEQDTIVMRRHDSSSIDSDDGKNRATRESRHSSEQRQRHHRHKKSSSSHPDRRSRSRSRSASRSKRDKSPSRSRSRSRSKSGARKERRRKDSHASTHAHRHRRHPQEESNRATHNRKVPPVKPPAKDERPLSPKKKRSMKDRLKHRGHSGR